MSPLTCSRSTGIFANVISSRLAAISDIRMLPRATTLAAVRLSYVNSNAMSDRIEAYLCTSWDVDSEWSESYSGSKQTRPTPEAINYLRCDFQRARNVFLTFDSPKLAAPEVDSASTTKQRLSMPPKKPQQSGGGKGQPAGKGKKKGGGGNDIGQAEEDPLVAVVLADSYNSRFSPLTLDKPRCLLPLLNAPMIDWTLEALALAGVEHTYVLARAHVELIREHISGRLDASYITVIATPEARSQGDALRELDGKQLIKSDFLLVHADGVGNMDLKEVIRIHKERRKADKDAIMTMCAMPTASSSRTR